MKKITLEELKEKIALHKLWLKDNSKGKRLVLFNSDLSNSDLSYSDLSYSNLSYSDLSNSDLSYSNLRNSNLRNSNLRNSNLRKSDLSNSDLSNSDLSNSDLSYSDLSYSNLRKSDLSNSNLSYSNLRNSNLRNSNLSNIITNEETFYYHLACPEEGSFTGYKKAHNMIVKLLITEDSLRSSATSLKCRCSKAKVISITDKEGNEHNEVASDYDSTFIYKKGEIIEVKDFDTDRWNECSKGIHFFINKQIAINY